VGIIATSAGSSKRLAANVMALQPLELLGTGVGDSLQRGSARGATPTAGCGSVALHDDRR
jgi:hypothetical protein